MAGSPSTKTEQGPTPAHSVARVLSVARILRPALVLLSAVAILSLVTLGLELRNQLRAFQEEPSDNIHWNVTQLELDIVRFEAQAEIVTLKPDASLQELRLRFDLFYSRAQSVLHGRMFSMLALTDLAAPMNQRLQRFLDVTTPPIDGDDAALRADLPVILQNAGALREDLRTMSVDLIDKYAAVADRRRAEFSNLLQGIAWLSALLLAVLILLLALVLWLNRQAERNTREIRRVSSRLAATVDTSLDAIIVTGRDGRVLDYNGAAATIFGYTAPEAIGALLSDLIVPPAQRQAHPNWMEQITNTGEMRPNNSGHFRITAMRKGGEQFPIEISLASTKGSTVGSTGAGTQDGGDMLFIAYLRDISLTVAAERSIMAARDKAMAAEQAKTNFMAVMCHEMRTPLNGLMAALDIASRQTMDDKQARFLDLARASSQQLLRHANEVLDISRIDSGGLHLTEEDFCLDALIEPMVGTLGHFAAQRGTTIAVTHLSAVPLLHGDSFRLGQILQNFLSNAIKFTDKGRITLEVEASDQTATHATLEIHVADTGIGIAKADQDRVFEDFVMIDPSYGRSSGGTGLGLAISRRLAHAMGGEIGVESDPGQGSCFWLRIPFRLAAPTGQTVATPSPAPSDRPALDILVVEDNATNRIVLEEMLSHLGQRVILAHDGVEGMTLARGHRFDIILMDISMPVMDGVTATEMIRHEGLSKSARIIAVTAHSMPQDRERFKAAGMDDHWTKPISEAHLRAIIASQAAAPRSDPDVHLVDDERLGELAEAMGQDGMVRLMAQFGRDLPLILQRLQTAADTSQTTALRAAAHEGAGSCAMVGATALGRHLARIEELCRTGDLGTAGSLLPMTATLWPATRRALLDRLQA